MKELEDIFSKNLPKTKKEIVPSIEILIDKREKQSLVAANLFENGLNCKFEMLEVGDYIVGEVIIERKTFSDFISSMISHRLQEQLVNLSACQSPLLLIEGKNHQSKIHPNAIKGMLLSIVTEFKIPTIFTEDEKETAEVIKQIARKQENRKEVHSIRASKKQKTLDEQKQFVLEGFPELGPSTAKKLLSKTKSLREIFNYSEKELEKTGMDKGQIERFRQILD
jgi:Fanconi anemia group M protein